MLGSGPALLAELLSGDGARILAAASDFTAAGPPPGDRSRLCSSLLEVLRDPQRSVVERVSAGDALGAIGDPRFDRDGWYLPRDESAGFLEVRTGTFAMGSERRLDPGADDDELSRHPVALPTYYIARYPVTVSQFREFALDVLGDPELDAPGYRTHRPVTHVCWVDAVAFCAWIEKRLVAAARDRLSSVKDPGARAFWQGLADGRLSIRLPSEAEWEKAARGDRGLLFPWGNPEDAARANTVEEGIHRPTPVGAMPGGASPYGCEEMSGNVWELTRSAFLPYPYDAAGEQRLAGDPRLRVAIRGGSFLSPRRLARCAARDSVPKGREGQDQGFRLVATPADAGDPQDRRVATPGLDSYLGSIPARLSTCLQRAVRSEIVFEQTGEVSELDESLRAWRTLTNDHAFPFTEAGFRNDVLCDAGRVYLLRYRVRGDRQDLEQAVDHLTAALALPVEPDPDVLGNLSNALRERHAAAGALEDLGEAIRVAERTIEVAPADSLALAAGQVALGLSLADRYQREGSLADLERALGLFASAADLVEPGSPDRASVLNNLGLGFGYLFERTRKPADLHRAVEAFRAAVQSTVGTPPELPVRLHNLSKALVQSSLESAQDGLLEEAIDASRRGVKLASPGSADLAMLLGGLAEALASRFQRSRDPADLGAAIEHWENAIAVAPPGGREGISSLASLAAGLIERHRLTGEPAAEQRATELLLEVCSEGPERAAEQVWKSARNWIAWAFERQAWAEVEEAWRHADLALERLLAVQLGRSAKETWLRESGAATCQAGYAIGKTGNLDAAVVALDRGLARLLAAALQAGRVELDAVAEEHRELVERYRAAASRAAQFEAQEVHRGIGRPRPDAAHARQAHADLSAAIEEIRRIPGHENFLRAGEIADLRAAARALGDHSALAYLATTAAGSVALLVTAERVDAVWAGLSTSELEAFLIRGEGGSVQGGYLPGILSGRSEAIAWLNDALDSIDSVCGELIGRLGQKLRQLGAERVVLLPLGRLRALPLHAVPYEDGGRSTCLLDELVVSHAPNAVAVLAASAEAVRRKGWNRMVAVGNPLPTRFALPAAEAEAREVAAKFPTAQVLLREAATRSNLLAAMRECDAIHLGCHGLFDLDSPLDSRLELAGADVLTLRDFLDGTADLPAARLAILSACRSAVAEPFELADEVISLPSGLLLCGVPGVVGTLWPVSDVSTAIVMVKFYDLLESNGENGEGPLHGASALAAAQRWLRDATPAATEELLAAHPDLRRLLSIGKPDASPASGRPYWSRPYHWAPFVYYGV